MLHVWANSVTEWYVAESADEAANMAREIGKLAGVTDDELDLDFEMWDDGRALTMDIDGEKVTRTCAEWAAVNGKGFLGTTEY